MNVVIEAENLTKSFGSLRAVDGISFQVRKGECFGILGPNGAGKTSTIRMLYGFSPKSGGILKIFGQDIDAHPRGIKARLGVCPQENNLDPDLTVRQNLEVFGRYFDLPRARTRERARELLDFIALGHRLETQVQELSGGMMRRLVLARALINDPELLILDEPTTGLDPQSRHQVWQRLDLLKSQGLTLLLTTHYMEEASRLCDRLIIIDHGKILVEGPPSTLVRRYVGRQVIELAEPSEQLRTFLRSRHLEFEDLGHRLLVYPGESDAVFQHIVQASPEQECALRPATLEDVFLRLTGRDLRE